MSLRFSPEALLRAEGLLVAFGRGDDPAIGQTLAVLDPVGARATLDSVLWLGDLLAHYAADATGEQAEDLIRQARRAASQVLFDRLERDRDGQ